MTSTTTSPAPLRVAMIGHAFMGAAHSHAWRNAHRFFDLPLLPVMQVVVGRDGGRAQHAADQLGWAGASTDWRAVVESHTAVRDVLTDSEGRAVVVQPVERTDFYAAARKAFAVVLTGETRSYACFLLTKGVVV